MKTSYFSVRTLKQRGGYALLLGLLIVVVIGMLIWYMRMHGPVYEIGEGKSDINPPSRQWHNLVEVQRIRNKPLGSPTEEQPQISTPLEIIAKPKKDGKERGELAMAISPDGTIKGGWGGRFYVDKDVDLQVMACNFKGFLIPSQVYRDEEGENPTKLFFITRGHFMMLETNSASGQVRNPGGNIYVRGWMDCDYQVDGELILTTDEKNFHLYTWQGQAIEITDDSFDFTQDREGSGFGF